MADDIQAFELKRNGNLKPIVETPLLQHFKTINIVFVFNYSTKKIYSWIGRDVDEKVLKYLDDIEVFKAKMNEFNDNISDFTDIVKYKQGDEDKEFFKIIGIKQEKFEKRINWWVDFQREQLEKIQKAEEKAETFEKNEKYDLALKAIEYAIKYADTIENLKIRKKEEKYIEYINSLMKINPILKRLMISMRNNDLEKIKNYKKEVLDQFDQLKLEINLKLDKIFKDADKIIENIERNREKNKNQICKILEKCDEKFKQNDYKSITADLEIAENYAKEYKIQDFNSQIKGLRNKVLQIKEIEQKTNEANNIKLEIKKLLENGLDNLEAGKIGKTLDIFKLVDDKLNSI